jgi:myo-inositol 2-dehydrogenase / D-chiro-inositol 1-dehydrogenase
MDNSYKDKGNNIKRRSALKRGLALGAPLILPFSIFGQAAPSERIRVGVIGAGGKAWGGAHNLRNFGGCDIVALSDPNRPRMDRYMQAFGVPAARCFGDHRRLLDLDDVDAVLIGSPDHWHVLHAKAAAEAGKHVYCEKPLSNTVAEGRALVQAVNKAGIVFQHGTQLRSQIGSRRVCQLVRNGYIGKVRKVSIGSPPGIATGDHPPQQPPAGLDWEMWVGPAPMIEYRPILTGSMPGNGTLGWYFVEGFSRAGWIAGYGVHDIDLAHWGLGFEHSGPVSIEGRGSFPQSGLFDTVLDYELLFSYADGTQIVMTDTSKNRHGVKFHAENGRDWLFCRGDMDASDRELLREKYQDGDTELYVSNQHEKNFADCIRAGDTNTIAPIEVAHRSTSVCLLAAICLKLGRKLDWDPQKERFVNDPEADRLLDLPMRPPWRL